MADRDASARYHYHSDQRLPLERTPALKLFWHGLPGGLFLLGLFAVGTVIVALLP